MLLNNREHIGSPYNGTIATDAYTGYDSRVNNLPEEERLNRRLYQTHARCYFFSCAKNANLSDTPSPTTWRSAPHTL